MKKILSIDSGGIRGIIPALILAELEARTSLPVSELFDFFVGTSTGGMLVLGLNCPAPSGGGEPQSSAAQVAGLFQLWGSRIFGTQVSKGNLTVSESTSEKRIQEMFREYFGTTLLSESIKPTLVTAFDLLAGRPFFFRSAKVSQHSSKNVFMWQAARATTALPSHFEPLHLSLASSPFGHFREVSLVDGSLFASNPAMCGLVEAHSLFSSEDDFLVVSLGCGEVPRMLPAFAATPKRRRMLDFSLTAQSDCVDYQLRTLLLRERYIRIQADLLAGFDRIDDASPQGLIVMKRVAQQTIARHSELLDRVVDLLGSTPANLELVDA
jgi:patatin-like phospholipase/acyl hydrolase